MKILIVYATIEGQTHKIAETMAASLEKRGHVVALTNSAEAHEFGLERPEAVILAAPVHAGRYPTPFVDFVHREQDWLNGLVSAFVSVTLSIQSEHEDERALAQKYPEALMAETGWKPDMVHHAAGALRYTQYDFFKRWIMREIARKEGARPYDGNDVEFTDWTALEGFLDRFLAMASTAATKV
ncbi:protoporphyrinogen oxidase [Rhizobium sp. KVB221]|uniref:Protoporphyrinogen oxidase n=1 Tax=Rhizobium setariae TaxID=2801340 RepID=A0A937CL98_9HYPH|nr:protoporphyrinogen oxidase [Rhizobium setariae]